MSTGRTRISHKIFSTLEIFLIMGILPLVVLFAKIHVFRHGVLLAGCLYTVIRLCPLISWRFLFRRPAAGWWRGPLLRGGLVFVLAVFYVQCTAPETLFQFPLERTKLWLLVVFLYPVLSVLPQELIFRVWLFEAHKALWVAPALPIVVSALAFGWVHIIFSGWFAVSVCTVGGLVLAWSYHVHRTAPGALWPLLLEHALYGLTMFTVGLGRYFFLPR